MSQPGGNTGSSGRGFLAGALAAACVAGALVAWIAASSSRHEAAARVERTRIVALRALTAAVEKAGGAGDGVRAAVLGFRPAAPEFRTIRVVAFEGLSLEASTAPADTGEKAAPRRLEREEKPLFDRGQELRQAIQTNVDEGAARKEEIAVRALDDGGIGLAAPVEIDGQVVGSVDVETVPVPVRGEGVPWGPLSWLLLPVAAVLAVWVPLGRNRHALAVIGGLALALGLGLFGSSAVGRLVSERQATDDAVAARATVFRAALPDLGLDPSSWDADLFRRPLDAGQRAAALAGDAAFLKKLVLVVGAFALAMFLWIGYGGAAATSRALSRHRAAYAYVAPAMIGMLVLVFFPFLYGIALSFTDSTLFTTNKSIVDVWVGLKHYGEILGDFSVVKSAADGSWAFNYQNFYWTFGFTILWTVSNVVFGVTVGLVLALILNTKGLALRPLYRVLLIFPWAMPNYITALIWKGMFHQQFGVVNQVLQIFHLPSVAWFEGPGTSFLTAFATNGWLSFPFMMVVSLGALQSIPADLYEAARVDGASKWQQFRSITLPSLKPALIPAIILSVVWTFNMFNIIYLVTAGEPAGSTEILITQSYKIAFEKYQYGYAAAYSTVIFMILLVYGWFQNRITRATEGV